VPKKLLKYLAQGNLTMVKDSVRYYRDFQA